MAPPPNNTNAAFKTKTFPLKLYEMLAEAEARGFSHVISWQPGGRSFKIHEKDLFVQTVLEQYFSQTKYKSFQRQLNIYGWKKVTHGKNRGSYIHQHFIDGKPHLCDLIVRRAQTQSAAQESKVSIPRVVPNDGLSSAVSHRVVPLAHSASPASKYEANLQLYDGEVESFYDFFFPRDPSKQPSFMNTLFSRNREEYFSARSYQARSYHHWERTSASREVLSDVAHGHASECIDPPVEYEASTDVQTKSVLDDITNTEDEIVAGVCAENTFPFKLHLLLSNAEKDGYSNIISWVKGGTAFKVHSHKDFVEGVLPMYFDQSKYESFRRQLNLYSFHRVSRGQDRGVISHPSFRASSRDLCHKIQRQQTNEAKAALV